MARTYIDVVGGYICADGRMKTMERDINCEEAYNSE